MRHGHVVAALNSVVHAMSVKMSPFVGVGFRVSRRRRRQKEMNFRIMLLELFLGRRFTVGAAETNTNEGVKSHAPDKAPARGGSSFN
ncbi:hypothetical protein M0R45_035966 [Rubus argutus]|uniref:Uncharacterized protein n=1 Tax=Rubus argutus TaxID=59490 RepID=A0AAW1VVQ7_RUBAR